MKKEILYVLSVLVLASCGATKVDEAVTLQSEEAVKFDRSLMQVPKKASDLQGIESGAATAPGQFSTSVKVETIMNFLASDELEGRDTGSEGIAKAAEYIENIFQANGVSPYFESYKDELTNFENAYNMVGWVEGNDATLKKEYIIIGAHYDHIGLIEEENGDVIANGANDNATGTTTVLELARYFGRNKTNKRSILFVLFSAEEKGLMGSKHLAKKLKDKNLNLYTMLNYEMVGVPLQGKEYLTYLTGYESSNLAEVANSYSDVQFVGFLPKAKEFGLFQRSDNFPFHQEFGVPAQTFCTFDFTNFDYYHKVGDEVSEIDFDHMANVINKSIPVIEGIANAAVQQIKYN